jgi:ketosteroid isomerase-like protein
MTNNRFIFAAALLGTLLASLTSAQQVKTDLPAAELRIRQTLAATEKQWLEAYYKLDRATLANMESDDFTMITPSVSLSKSDQLSMVEKRAAVSRPSGTSGGCSVRSQNIREFGSVALISDICTVTEGGDNPITAPGSYWQTQLWQQQQGAWKIVYLHISPLEHGM